MSNPTLRIAAGNRHTSFVVRVWSDPAPMTTAPGSAAGDDITANPPRGAVDGIGLRGSVEHVGTRALRYFASLEAMREIIADVIDRSSTLAATPAHADGNARSGRQS